MKYSIVNYICGICLVGESFFLLLPLIVSLIYGEGTWYCYLVPAVCSFLLGFPLTRRKPKANLSPREGSVLSGVSVLLCMLVALRCVLLISLTAVLVVILLSLICGRSILTVTILIILLLVIAIAVLIVLLLIIAVTVLVVFLPVACIDVVKRTDKAFYVDSP